MPKISFKCKNLHWNYKKHIKNRFYIRNVRYTDIPKISVLKPIPVYRYEFFSHTDIPKFPIYRNFSVYRIKFIHRAYGEIINFCFTQMQSKRSKLRVKNNVNSFEIILNGVSTFEIIQNQNFLQISTKEFSYLI